MSAQRPPDDDDDDDDDGALPPTLHLVPGDKAIEMAFDLEALADFFERVTGRRPTPEEMAEARDFIEQHKH